MSPRPLQALSDPATLDTQARAWVGDAVLALVVREFLLEQQITFDSGANPLFQEMTSNQFLNRFGRPTEIEAWIGEIYLRDGLEAARTAIQTRFGSHYTKILRSTV